jgi:hypothetical protein
LALLAIAGAGAFVAAPFGVYATAVETLVNDALPAAVRTFGVIVNPVRL